MDVRLGPFRISSRPDRAHDLAFANRSAHRKADRSEVNQGHRVAVLRTDRQTKPLARQVACEGDDSGRRSAHAGSSRSPDVDPAMLAARIRVVPCDERPQHRPLDRPAPRSRARDLGEGDEQHGREHDENVARFENHAQARYRVGRLLSNLITGRLGRACSEPGRSDGRRRLPPVVAPLLPARARPPRQAPPPRRQTPARAPRARA